MKYTIHQIVLSDADHKHINNVGWELAEKVPKIKAYMNTSTFGEFEPGYLLYYSAVREVEVYKEVGNDLEAVFAHCNDINCYSVKTLGVFGPCRSLSVGDIIERQGGRIFLCERFGFSEILLTRKGMILDKVGE